MYIWAVLCNCVNSCFTSSLVHYENLLENCWKCDILEYWGTFHNSFHNLNVTLSCLHNTKQEWKAWKLHLILSPQKTLGTHTPAKRLNLFDYLWRVFQYSQKGCSEGALINFGTGKIKQGIPPQSNGMNSTFSLSLLEIFCLQSLVLSAHMYVLTFQDQHTLPKWNILIACSYMSRERIYHFGKVCWSWKANTYIRAERTRLWWQNIFGKQREKVEFIQAKSHSYEQVCLIV